MLTDWAKRPSTTEQKMYPRVAPREWVPNWFAAYTNSHHEKRVAAQFAERQIESFLPLYVARHRWRNGCDMKLDLPLFPNYVFVRVDPRKRVSVLEVPGVVSLVGFGRTLAPLPDFEIEALRSSIGRRKIEPHPYLVIGERVRIKAGPMAGMEGVVVRRKNNFRVVLTLDAIMQCVAVEVDADELEAAAKQAGRVVLPRDFAARSKICPQSSQ
ncbi:MAG: UpxY family transcription antiterminator [Terriglobales bacterium]|jgi:transcription antitermination factor NusG